MQRTLKLQTDQGDRIRIVLENWGSGLDEASRRWTKEGASWLCVDSGQLAQKAGMAGLKFFETAAPLLQFVPSPVSDDRGADDLAEAFASGQTMVEYLMIIAVAGAVAWGSRNFIGHDVGALMSNIGSSLGGRPGVASVQEQASGGVRVDLSSDSDKERRSGAGQVGPF
jgi:hypothetical protein